jgi:hypothetical protein
MAWSEANAWLQGTAHQNLYQALLDDAAEMPARNARRKKVVRPATCRGRCRARASSSTC